MHQKQRESLPGLTPCSFDGWHTQVPWGTGAPEVCCHGVDLQRSEKQQGDSGGLYCLLFSSSSDASEHTSPLCSGLAKGKALTVLTFPCWHFWDLGSLCTCRPDSFLPLTYASWQSVRQPWRMRCQARLAGPKQTNDKGQQGIPCSSKQLCCGQKGEVHTPPVLSICVPVVSAVKPLLCGMGGVLCSGGRLWCLDLQLSLAQPISCCTVITFSHPIFLVLFLLVLLSDDGFLPCSFLFFVYCLLTPGYLFIFFLVLRQSSSPCL